MTSHQSSAVHPNTTADPSVQTLVRALHLCRETTNRGHKTVILDDVSFEIPARTLFAVSGPSGSGKSTLLNMLTGVDRPTSGQVLFAGQELRARSENALARWRGRNVGIIFQFFQLIPTLTAAENVLLALELGGGGGLPRREWQKRAGTCLEMVGVGGLCPAPAQRTFRRSAAACGHRAGPGQRPSCYRCR